MKNIFAILLVLIYSASSGQDLKNTEWVKIKEQRKDGSRILDRLLKNNRTKYYFSDYVAFIAVNEQYESEQNYAVNNNVLTIGQSANFRIDSVNEMFLGLTEMSKNDLPDNVLNSFVFINSKFLFDYEKQRNQLTFIGDSILICDDAVSPAYKGDLNKVFLSEFGFEPRTLTVTGSLNVSSNGVLQTIYIDSAEKLSKRDLRRIIRTFKLTDDSWRVPHTPMPLIFKMNFALIFNYTAPALSINIQFNPGSRLVSSGLSIKQRTELGDHFNNGIRLFKINDFEKAISEFQKCTEIFPLYVEAFYNIALSYQMLGNMSRACENWSKLTEMGQKGAEGLYNEHCKL